MASLTTITTDDINYIRLQCLVGKIGTKVLREYFDNSPRLGTTVLQACLVREQANLQSLKRRGTVNASQWDLLYPPGGAAPSSTQFDLTLLVLLLRNCGALGEPRNFKWGELPLPTDIAIYHDVARLKYHRNKYAHATSGISDVDFAADWKELEGALLRIVPATEKAQLTSEMEQLRTTPLNQEDLVRRIDTYQNEVSIYSKEIKTTIRNATRIIINKIESSKLAVKNVVYQQSSQIKSHINEAMENQREYTQNVTDQQTAVIVQEINKQLKNHEETGDKGNISDILHALGRKLKKNYKERFKKVQSVSSDGGGPTLFDVTSKLYMDLDCTPLEVRCTNVGDTNRERDRKQKQKRQREDQDYQTSAKRSKSQNRMQTLEQIPKTSTQTESLEIPVQMILGGKNEDESTEHCQITPNTHVNMETEPIQCENSFIEEGHSLNQQEQITVKTENKPTSTAQISRLFTEEANPDKLPILVEAEAGVGKTTFFHRLALNWANDLQEMEQFKLVFLIPLRRVRSKKIEDIICDDLQLLLPEHKQDLKKCLDLWDDQIIFLIDGLDEVQLAPDSELTKLLKGTDSYVFCSSRPMLKEPADKGGYHGMENYLLVRLLGFSDETLVKYINEYFRDIDGSHVNMADTVMAECSKHFYCKALMKIPLYAGIFCFLQGKYNNEFPDTATQLFNKFLLEILNNYLFRYSHPQGSCSNKLHMMKPIETLDFVKSPMENTVPPELRCKLRCISKLAYTTLMQHKVIFTVEDADKSDLSLDNLVHIGLFTVEEDDGSVIYFRHKLFHEYFAGLYLTLHDDQICTLFTDSRDQIISGCHILQNAFFFAAGLCEDTFKRIIFALKYSFHQSQELLYMYTNSCESCKKEIKKSSSTSFRNSDFAQNHKESCSRCLEQKSRRHEGFFFPTNTSSKFPTVLHCRMEHEFDLENIDECDSCYKMAIAMMYPGTKRGKYSGLGGFQSDPKELSFVVQLAFEHHAFGDDKAGSVSNLSRLPVYCSSAHSLASSMYTLGMIEQSGSNTQRCRSIVLIDRPMIDMDQLLSILLECNKNEDFKFMTLIGAGPILIEEILKMEWKYIEKLGFEECQILVPIAKVARSFPQARIVLYDKSTWESGEMYTSKENMADVSHEIAIIIRNGEKVDGDKVSKIDHRYVDSCETCRYLKPSFFTPVTCRIVTTWVEEFEEWPSEDRKKCIPESLIKGICLCRHQDRYGFDIYPHSITGEVQEHGLQWKHHDVLDSSSSIKGQEDFRIDFHSGKITLQSNLKRHFHDKYIREMIDYITLITEDSNAGGSQNQRNGIGNHNIQKITNLVLYRADKLLCCDLLKTKCSHFENLGYIQCEGIVPVDVIAAYFPQVKKVQYDEETLKREILLTASQTSEKALGKKTFWIRLHENETWPCSVCTQFQRASQADRQICVGIKYPKTHVLGSPKFSQWEKILSSPVIVREFCSDMLLLDQPFRHLEYFHTAHHCDIAKVCEQNPGLRRVARGGFKLDLSKNVQEQLSRFNEFAPKSQSGEEQWRATSIVFDCDCILKCFTLEFSLKSVEIPFNKVEALVCQNIDNKHGSEEDAVKLQHLIAHSATKEERDKPYIISQKTVRLVNNHLDTQYIHRELQKNGYNPIYFWVREFTNQKVSVVFTRGQL